MERALTQGVIIGDMQYRAIITRSNKGALPNMVRVHAAGIPFADLETLKKNLAATLAVQYEQRPLEYYICAQTFTKAPLGSRVRIAE
jgi:hypothetical protein